MVDIGLGLDGVRRLLLQIHHVLEGDVLPRLGRYRQSADVLGRQEALGDSREQVDSGGYRAQEDEEHDRLCPEAEIKRGAIGAKEPAEKPIVVLDLFAMLGVALAFAAAWQAAAEHGGQR